MHDEDGPRKTFTSVEKGSAGKQFLSMLRGSLTKSPPEGSRKSVSYKQTRQRSEPQIIMKEAQKSPEVGQGMLRHIARNSAQIDGRSPM